VKGHVTTSPRPGSLTPWDSAWCSPSIVFRRMQFSSVDPTNVALGGPKVYLVDLAANRSTLVPYNAPEDSYGFTLASGRGWLLYHDTPARIDVNSYW
jgi:hypothetical protein